MPITDNINCTCVDSTGYRTLAQLRKDVYAALGFIDPRDITQSRIDMDADDAVRLQSAPRAQTALA